MNNRVLLATVCVAGAAASSAAQQGVATYSIAFGSPGGTNSVFLAPGQSVDVFVNVSFSPGVGQAYQGGTIVGLSDGEFSISAPSASGAWTVNSTPTAAGYSLPHPWGAQFVGGLGVNAGTGGPNGVSGVVWGYGFLLSTVHTHPQNPATVWMGSFTCGGLEVTQITFTGLAPTNVFVASAGSFPGVAAFSSVGLTGSIFRIPGPGAPAAVVLGLIAMARRRR